MAIRLPPPFDLALAGSSFFGLRNVGVAQCLLDHGSFVVDNTEHFGGASFNALVAAVMATASESIANYMYSLYDIVDVVAPLPFGALSPEFNFVDCLRSALSENLPSDAHEKATGRLYIKATSLKLTDTLDQGTRLRVHTKGTNVFEIGDRWWEIGDEVEISRYKSREELIEVLLGCVYVPWFPHWPAPSYEGRYLGDATLSRTSNPPLDVKYSFRPANTLIEISPDPKSGATVRDKIACDWTDATGQRFDVSALEMFRAGRGLHPPPKGHMEAYYADGYEDATRFLKFHSC